MKKLTELEIEKIQTVQQKEQELNQLKAVVGDLTIQLELYKSTSIQKQLEVSKESESLKDSLEAKYGKGFQIQEDGTVITSEDNMEVIDSKEVSE